MKTFSKIEYVDAFYISDDNLEQIDLYPHVSYGRVYEERDSYFVYSLLSKKNTLDGDFIIEKGLLVPLQSLISSYKKIDSNIFLHSTVNKRVAIEWNDIVYFEEEIPSSLTKMYTEGEVVIKTDTFLVVKDPITIRVSPLPIKNHPKYTPFYYVIPLSFIMAIEIL
jgi:hypothetical protein